jgi:transcriptional regulator with XRE-family HTH domain
MTSFINDKPAQDIGKRLKFCRNLLGKTLREFASAASISYATLSRYERGMLKISRKSIDKIIYLFLSQGINCSKDWLLYGKGEMPLLERKEESDNPLNEDTDITDAFVTFNELSFIQKNIPNTVIRCIEDNSMYPVFQIGDYVAGHPIGNYDLRSINGEYCIIELPDKRVVVRQFFIKDNLIALIPLNTKEFPDPIYIKEPHKSLYPITYHRKVISPKKNNSL